MPGRKFVSAHRLSWELHHERSVPRGQCVLHRCDNPACVNPAHLFLGTQLDNARDREAKGRRRAPKGALNGRAKLTEADVRDLLRRHVPGVTQTWEHMARYGVSKTVVNGILRGDYWKHVPRPRGLCPKPQRSGSGAEL